jgi:hypothetical protein
MFVSLVLLVAAAKKQEHALEDVAQVAGTLQNLNNLYSLDFYAMDHIYKLKTPRTVLCFMKLFTDACNYPPL